MIQDGLYSLLSEDPKLSAIVGDRITPVLLPEGSTTPALTYMVAGGSSDPTFSTSGMQRLRVQFDVHADPKDKAGYRAAIQAREALRLLLDGYRGMLSDGTYLQNAQRIQDIDYFDDGPRQFRCSSEFYFWFTFNS